MAYVATVPKQYRSSMMQSLAVGYINRSPAEGMSWLMAQTQELSQVVMIGAMSMLAGHPEIAESWLKKLDVTHARSTVLQIWSRSEPQVVAAIIDSGVSIGAQQWARTDAEAALDWLESQPIPAAGILPWSR